jgi:hypothetical protein
MNSKFFFEQRCSLSSVAPFPLRRRTRRVDHPFPPFRIAGNLYYVGSQDLASYLIATPRASFSSTASLKPRCR